ncbi:MAG TPA: hypothetical protein VHE09_09855 [Rhizomicrobium sp.]|nr:hypothetical protein [Rhizomicrobium sp.]
MKKMAAAHNRIRERREKSRIKVYRHIAEAALLYETLPTKPAGFCFGAIGSSPDLIKRLS